jgi:pilus assembly protein Flp/PilA
MDVRPSTFRTARKDVNLSRMFRKFLANESGATAIEYCLIAAAIALAIIAVIQAIGVDLVAKLTALAGYFN